MEREHGGYRIEVHSYKSTGGRWRPDIFIALDDGNEIRERHFFAAADMSFPGEPEADAWGMTQAVALIDHGGAPGVEEDPAPETTADECPYCGSRDTAMTGGSTQVGIGNPRKEGRQCLTCDRYFRRIVMPRQG